MLKRSITLLLITLYAVTMMGLARDRGLCGNPEATTKSNSAARSCNMRCPARVKCIVKKHVEPRAETHHATSQLFLFTILAARLF